MFTASLISLVAYIQAAVGDESRKLPLLFLILVLAGMVGAAAYIVYCYAYTDVRRNEVRPSGLVATGMGWIAIICVDALVVCIFAGEISHAALAPKLIAGGAAMAYTMCIACASVLMCSGLPQGEPDGDGDRAPSKPNMWRNIAKYDVDDWRSVQSAGLSLLCIEVRILRRGRGSCAAKGGEGGSFLD